MTITFTNWTAGIETTIACDAVVDGAWTCCPTPACSTSVDVAEDAYAIGDCNEPYNIALAIRGGNDVGRAL